MRVKSRLEHCSHGAEQEQALQRRLEVQELLSRLLSSTGVRRRRASDMHSLSNLKGCEPYAARTVLGGGGSLLRQARQTRPQEQALSCGLQLAIKMRMTICKVQDASEQRAEL
jgi:hypothetical protein